MPRNKNVEKKFVVTADVIVFAKDVAAARKTVERLEQHDADEEIHGTHVSKIVAREVADAKTGEVLPGTVS